MIIPIPTYVNPYPEDMPMGDVNEYLNDLGIGQMIDGIIVMCIALVILMIFIPLLPHIIRYIRKDKKKVRFKHRKCAGTGMIRDESGGFTTCEECGGYGYIELTEEDWSVLK
jgi:hypothetical protein